MAWNDDEDEDVTGRGIEGPDDADVNEEEAEVPCPYCKRDIPEDTPRCPYCGCYLSREDAPRGRREWWWFAALGLVIVLIVAWVMRRW